MGAQIHQSLVGKHSGINVEASMNQKEIAKRIEATSKLADKAVEKAHALKDDNCKIIGVGIISMADHYAKELDLDTFDRGVFEIVFRHSYIP